MTTAISHEVLVNSIITGSPSNNHSAAFANGNYITVWQAPRDTDGQASIFAQLFYANGTPIGHEFQIDDPSIIGGQVSPRVITLSDGGFVVTWTGVGTNDSSGVFARKFDANSQAVTANIQINETTSSGQYSADLVELSTGELVFAWHSDASANNGINYRSFDSNLNATGPENTLSPTNAGSVEFPIIDSTANGFTIAWYSNSNTSVVNFQQFNNDLTLSGTEQQVGIQASGDQINSDIDYFSDGSFVITWEEDNGLDGSGDGVYSQRFNADGTQASGVTLVNSTTSSHQNAPSVSVLDDDTYVVAWYGRGLLDGQFREGIIFQHFAQDGSPIGTETYATSLENSNGSQFDPQVLATANGDFVISWRSNSFNVDGNTERGIVQRVFTTNADPQIETAPQIVGFNEQVIFQENDVNDSPQVIDIAVAVLDQDSSNFDGGSLSIAYIDGGTVDDTLSIRNQGTGSNQISISGNQVSFEGVVFATVIDDGVNGAPINLDLNVNATADAIEALLENLQFSNSSESPELSRTISIRLNDGDNNTNVNVVSEIIVEQNNDSIAAVGESELVNTFTNSTQANVAGATFDDGGFILVWDSYSQNDSFNTGIHAQRYNANGEPVGIELQINGTDFAPIESAQSNPDVVTYADGSFLVVWQGAGAPGEDSSGIFARLFNADGTPIGNDFQINEYESSTQSTVSATRLSNGHTAITWQSWGADSNAYGITARILDENGNFVGSEFVINETSTGNQTQPSIDAYDGGFVVSWQSNSQSGGSSDDVVSRRINNDGSFANTEQDITLGESRSQVASQVRAFADGSYIVTWTDNSSNSDGNGAAVVAQLFSSDDTPVGSQVVINENSPGSQYQVDLTITDSGNIVFTWHDSSLGNIMRREFTSSLVAIDSEVIVESNTNTSVFEPIIVGSGDNYFIAFEQSGTGFDGTDISLNRFGSIQLEQGPQITGLSESYTFAENDVNAAAIPIELGIAVQEGSAGFTNGSITIGYNAAGTSDDQLVIQNQGNGPNQVSISGSDLLFEGNIVGTIESDGSNGQPLQIQLNSSANTEAVENILEAVAYQNLSNSPEASRSLSIRLSDGNGNASDNFDFTINVTSENDSEQISISAQQVNTFTNSSQYRADVDAFDDGSYVVVWESAGQQSNSGVYSIHAQKFSAEGQPIGIEILVSDGSLASAAEQNNLAKVTTFSDGSFMVVWEGQESTSGDIVARLFDANGNPVGEQFQVNDFANGNQFIPDIARLSNGDVAITWATNGPDSSGYGIAYRILQADGTAVTGDLIANTTTANTQYQPSIAAGNGKFAITWYSDDATNSFRDEIVVREFNNDGTAAAGEIAVSSGSTADQREAKVSYASDGSFVVTWTDFSNVSDGSSSAILAQRFDSTGVATGDTFLVNEVASNGQNSVSISHLSNDNFVITWYSTQGDVIKREFSSDGQPLDGDQIVHESLTTGTQSRPSVVGLNNGEYVIVFDDNNSEDGSGLGVFQSLFGTAISVANPQLQGLAASVNFSENAVNNAAQTLDVAVSLTDIDSPTFNGGKLTLGFIQNGSEDDQLSVNNEGNGSGQIAVSGTTISYSGVAFGTIVSSGDNGNSLVVEFNTNASLEAVEALVENLAYANPSQAPAASRTLSLNIEDGTGASTGGQTIEVTIEEDFDATPNVFGPEMVNTYNISTQFAPAADSFSDGSYIVTWYSSGQDDSSNGIYAQRFDANGLPVGREFKVNTEINSSQDNPSVTVLNDGSYVITWDGNGVGDNDGVFAQRYAADDTPLGGEFLLRDGSNGSESNIDMVALSNGQFAVTYTDNNLDGSGNGVAVRLFNADGTPVGASFAANTTTSGTQATPSIDAHASGFIVSWYSNNQANGDSNDIVIQRFDNSGNAIGGEIDIIESGSQSQHDISTFSDGSFVVVYASNDGSNDGVFAQLYNADGTTNGESFIVNETISASQYEPSVITLPNGNFIVSWRGNGEGDSDGIFTREFTSDGDALDGENLVSTTSVSSASSPVLTSLGTSNNFAVFWSDFNIPSTGNGWDVFQSIFGNENDFSRPVQPVLDDVTSTRQLVNASSSTPVRIDADIDLSHTSDDYNGGSVEVYYLTTSDNDDLLGIDSVGSGQGQIEVSGNSVSYQGTVIGQINSTENGSAGAALTINLNSAATTESVQTLIEHLTYASQNNVDNDEYIAIKVTDGAGASSNAAPIFIDLRSSVSTPSFLLEDFDTNIVFQESDVVGQVVGLDSNINFEYNGTNTIANRSLTLTYLSSTPTFEDTLTVISSGSGAGQISVNGDAISYEGQVFANIDSTLNGQNGQNLTVNFNASATDESVEALIEALGYSSDSGALNDRSLRLYVYDSANQNSQNIDFSLSFEPSANDFGLVGSANIVNQVTASNQSIPHAANLENGGYVVTWMSDGAQDGNSNGIFAQLFAENGQAIGNQFVVNTENFGSQTTPNATGLSDGSFIVTWAGPESETNSDVNVYAQRFDASGVSIGDQFIINQNVSSSQDEPSVIALPNGGFAVAFVTRDSTTGDSSGDGIGIRYFDVNNSPITDELLVNSVISGAQTDPSLSSNGSSVMVTYKNANGDDIFARILNTTDGSEIAAEFKVNTSEGNVWEEPTVTALDDGSYVIVWGHYIDEFNTDFWGFRGQRVDANGNFIGDEFIVNTNETTWTSSNGASITTMANGNFAVSWDTGAGVYVQEFDVSGATPIKVDGPILAGNGPSTDRQSTLVSLGQDSLAVVWSAYNFDNGETNTYEIVQQFVGSPSDFVASSAPAIENIPDTIELIESNTNEFIFSGVDIIDVDSNNFDGGELAISFVGGYTDLFNTDMAFADESWIISNQGTGPGEISISGTDISFQGTVIGTVVEDGQNGNELRISLNADATNLALTALVQNIAYFNSSTAPQAQRQVAIRLTDGDGGSNENQTFTIDITPVVSGFAPQTGDVLVNSVIDGPQTNPSMAEMADGSFVVVWTSEASQDGNSYGVFAQRYSANGSPIGNEIPINTSTLGSQYEPQVAAHNDGFVVVWRDGNSLDGSSSGIFSQAFNQLGEPVGPETLINDTVSSSQTTPDIVELSTGGYAVVWRGNGVGDSNGVFAKIYDSNGQPLSSEFLVNEFSSGTQSEPKISELSNGNLVAVFNEDNQIAFRLINADGTTTASQVVIDRPITSESDPDVAALADGSFVVSYTVSNDGSGSGVFAQRFDANGVAIGDEFRVNDGISGSQYESSIDALATGGFVIAFSNSTSPDAIFTQEFDANGIPVDGNIEVNVNNVSTDWQPSVLGLSAGGFITAWSGYRVEPDANNSYGVFWRGFGADGQFSDGIGSLEIAGLGETISLDESELPQNFLASADLFNADSNNFDGGSLTISVVSGYGATSQFDSANQQDNFSVQNTGSGIGEIAFNGTDVSYEGIVIGTVIKDGQAGNELQIDFNANANQASISALLQALTYANSSDGPALERTVSIRLTDADGNTTSNNAVNFVVNPIADGSTAQGDAIQVNTFTESDQRYSSVTELDDGSIVVTWQSTNQDGWNEGIVAQRFDANGSPIGNEFIVNEYTPTSQTLPSITAISGGFVAVWQGRGEGDSNGVFGRLFDSNGVAQGDDFIINDTINSSQDTIEVISTDTGGFAVTFRGNGSGDGNGVFFATFDANGNALVNETLVNDNVSLGQSAPDITQLLSGQFAITYVESSDIVVRLMNADGSVSSAAISVANSNDSEYEPRITALDNGDFVVVYTDSNDTNSTGVFAQRFDASGVPIGELLRVNENVSGQQYQADVTAVSGGFVVSYSDSNNPDSILVQQFSNDGSIIDSPIKADTNNSNFDIESSITALSGGGFAVTWTGYNAEPDTANSYGILMRLYGSDGQFTTSQAPVLEIAANSIEYTENSLNFGPQILFVGAGVADPDTTDFSGGQLEISRISSYGQGDQLGRQAFFPQDNLGIQNQGTGNGQISVSGNQLSYEGIVIGTIDSNGSNDSALVVTFNSNASAQSIEALLEAVTYRNISDAPESTRTYSVRLTDGNGGSSIAETITVNISQNLDGNLPTLEPERTVNTTVNGDQTLSQTAALADENGEAQGYVVAWSDSNSGDLYFQVYDETNNPVGTEQVANTTTNGSQSDITVQSLNNGTFVMTWTSSGQGINGNEVVGRIFNNDGTPYNQPPHNGAEFIVNELTTSTQSNAQIAANLNGSFAVTYQSFDSSNGDTSGSSIALRLFDASGQPLDNEIRVNTTTASSQTNPDISTLQSSTALPNGGYIVTWESPDASSSGIFAQVFDENGDPVGTEFTVNTSIDNSQSGPQVVGIDNGDFIITWTDSGTDLSNSGVFAQRFTFSSDGQPVALGDEFRVNQEYVSSQYQPQITALADGGFAIAYTGRDSSNEGIFVQEFDSAGRLIDRPQLVNQFESSTQNQPSIAGTLDGGFIVSWTSFVGGAERYDISLQRFGNNVPETTDFDIQGNEDESIAISADDFINAFNDPEGEPLQEIVIITLPINGDLLLDGNLVQAGQIIDINQIQNSSFEYVGDENFNGIDSLVWSGSDGVSFAEPANTNISVLPVNDAPGMDVGVDDTGTESFSSNGFTHVINFAEPDGDTLLVTVDWGDNSTPTVYTTSSNVLNTSHRYLDDGIYTVTVTVDDQSGTPEAIETQTYQATISNIAPSIGLFGSNTVEQDDVYTLTIGNPSDPGDDAVTEFIVDWGDNTIETFTNPGDVTHVYSTPGDYDISIDLVDEDGTYVDVSTKSIQVSAPAEVLDVVPIDDLVVNEGTNFAQLIEFTDPTDQNPNGWTYTIDWGDGTVQSDIRVSSRDFNVFHNYADDGNYNVEITVSDDNGNQTDTETFNIQVNDVAPNVDIFGSGVVDEGSQYTLSVNVFDPGEDTISQFIIDWGDGTTDTINGSDFGNPTHVYDDGPFGYTITVDVVNEDGVFEDVDSQFINVRNVAPISSITGPTEVEEDTEVTFTFGDITDPGDDTITNTVIDWGDGSTTQYTGAGDYSHTFEDGNVTRAVRLLVTDEDADPHVAAEIIVDVSAFVAEIDVAAQANATVDEGDTLTRTISFTDGEDNGDVGYTVDIDWDSDGTIDESFAVTSNSFDISQTFADGPATQTVSVTVTDDAGESDTETFDVTINNVAPVGTITGPDTVEEGTEATFSFGEITDVGLDTITSAVIEWGDGTTTQYTGAGNYSHVYADGDSNQTITLTATDEDANYIVATFMVAVTDAEPSITLTGNSNVEEGSPYTLTLSDLLDPGEDTISAIEIDWGDGSAIETVTSLGDVQHVYADGNDSATIAVTLVNEDGRFDGGTLDVDIDNVAPTMAINGAASTIQNATYTLNLGSVIDPGDDTIVANGITVDWGDGNVDTYSSVGDVTHSYTSVGDFTISIDLEDEDGVFTDVATQQVTVEAPADTIDVAAQASATVDEGDTLTRTISFTDGEDNGDVGYTVDIDWDSDGTIDESFAVTSNSFDISQTFADGPATQTVSVTVTDDAGESDTETFDVTINNVAPVGTITGPDTVEEGTEATFSFGEITDVGLDTVTSAVIEWGDGTTTQYTGAGNYSHVYADGDSNQTITLTATDEDANYIVATFMVAVTDAEPSITLTGNSNVDEGSPYTLTLSDLVDPGEDIISAIEIDWGDGSAIQTVTSLGDVQHVYADGNDSATIAVTLVNEDGRFDGGTLDVDIDNVAPTMAINGAASTIQNATYTLNLGSIIDPGDDTIVANGITVDWGDGNVDTYSSVGDVTHSYTSVGDFTISIDLEDEDGVFTDVATQQVTVETETTDPVVTGEIQEFALRNEQVELSLTIDSDEPINEIIVDWGDGNVESFSASDQLVHDYQALGLFDVSVQVVTDSGTFDAGFIDDIDVGLRIGDAPTYPSWFDPFAWQNAWTDDGISLSHRSDTANESELWSDMSFVGWDTWVLSGQDIAFGLLGVSGRTATTGSYFQQMDGTEGIRIDLDSPALNGQISFSDLRANESGSLDEQARVQLFDANGVLVDEYLVQGDEDGEVVFDFTSDNAFDHIVISTGGYDENGNFIFGSYVDDNEVATSSPANTGSQLLLRAIQIGYRGDESIEEFVIEQEEQFDFTQDAGAIDVYKKKINQSKLSIPSQPDDATIAEDGSGSSDSLLSNNAELDFSALMIDSTLTSNSMQLYQRLQGGNQRDMANHRGDMYEFISLNDDATIDFDMPLNLINEDFLMR